MEIVNVNLRCEETCEEICDFLKNHYADEDNIQINFSVQFLRWALCPPGYYDSWNVGVRDQRSKELIGFVSGVPELMKVNDQHGVAMARICFLCVHKQFRSQGIASAMIKKMTTQVQLNGIHQAVYADQRDHVSPPPTRCLYWMRILEPTKMVQVGFAGEEMTKNIDFSVPDGPLTLGFREMEQRDGNGVKNLLNEMIGDKKIGAEWNSLEKIEHSLMPREGVFYSFVVEDAATHEITDFCSFYALPLTVVNKGKITTLKCAYSYYNVATQTSIRQLMKDALVVSKRKGFDAFYCLEVIHEYPDNFFADLKFVPGNKGVHLNYYVRDSSLVSPLKPSEFGVILW